MTRGHIRTGRAFGKAMQEDILRKVDPKIILYVDDIEGAIKSCRAGEILYVVGLRGLSKVEREIVKIVNKLHEKRSAAIDAGTGRRSDGKDGHALMAEAYTDLRCERLGGKSAAQMDGAKGGAAAGEKRRARKTPLPDAEKIWFDKSLTTDEALVKINAQGYHDDWLPGALYKKFGKRGVTPGRIGVAGRKPPPDAPSVLKEKAGRSKRGYVYFMRINGRGPVKIGFASDIKARLSSHSTSNHGKCIIVAAMHGTIKAEGALHKKYAALTIPGKREWFKMAEPLKSFIEALPDLDDEDDND